MPKPAFRNDEELTDILKITYRNAREDGLSKKEAHAFAFGRMLDFKRNGRVPADPELPLIREDRL